MAGISREEIANRFKHHPPTSHMIVAAHERVREVLGDAAQELCMLVPAGREQSLMVTYLENAMYEANAGIARTQQVGG